jgi:hypothetical protein
VDEADDRYHPGEMNHEEEHGGTPPLRADATDDYLDEEHAPTGGDLEYSERDGDVTVSFVQPEGGADDPAPEVPSEEKPRTRQVPVIVSGVFCGMREEEIPE